MYSGCKASNLLDHWPPYTEVWRGLIWWWGNHMKREPWTRSDAIQIRGRLCSNGGHWSASRQARISSTDQVRIFHIRLDLYTVERVYIYPSSSLNLNFLKSQSLCINKTLGTTTVNSWWDQILYQNLCACNSYSPLTTYTEHLPSTKIIFKKFLNHNWNHWIINLLPEFQY